MCERTLFDGCFELVLHVKVKHVFYGRIIRSTMVHFKSSALIRWSAENCQVSLKQFKKRESIGFDQTQGLCILTSVGKPKYTICAIVILEIFNSRIPRIHVDVQFIIDSLARIFDKHAKVTDVIILIITAIFNSICSFDGTSQGYPIRGLICLYTAYVWCLIGHAF